MKGELNELINEVRLLYQSLVQLGDRIHTDANMSMGMRAVLEYLEREGATTVPDMARARRVTRQRVQALANALIAQGLVMSVDNPKTRRSPLMDLTRPGTKTIAAMRRREGRYAALGIGSHRLREAARVLKDVRSGLERQVEARD